MLDTAKALPDPFARVVALETSFAADINHPRFHPFLALHEFESWIFSAPAIAEEHLSVKGVARELENATIAAGGAELVNDGPTTHPSLRLAGMVARLGARRYGKVADGPDIIAKAGLQAVRSACPHFAEWLNRLARLTQ